MPVQIFVEDRYTDTYEILARRVRGDHQVRASRIDPEDLTSFENLLDLVQRSARARFDCVLFIMDEEGPDSPERPAKLASFRQAFQELCGHLLSLPPNDFLRRVRVTRVVCRRCQEGWLAADPQAVVDAFRGPKGVDWRPPVHRTDELTPRQASEAIVHIARAVGRRIERSSLRTFDSRDVKARGKDIAAHLDPARARAFNSSLAYFLDMVDGRRSGCDHPFPDP
ncbi:MAG TPA: hypothetical protein VJ885_06975 [Thermoanaerobaculia bacterium]|nr:hypothetical protein [Thermoanaerobaculia bacterium]